VGIGGDASSEEWQKWQICAARFYPLGANWTLPFVLWRSPSAHTQDQQQHHDHSPGSGANNDRWRDVAHCAQYCIDPDLLANAGCIYFIASPSICSFQMDQNLPQ
jgi:hypothetical protein